MASKRNFLKIARQDSRKRIVCERIKDYRDVCELRPAEKSEEQASRCMDCATPFCHWGCPIGNYIPEWNDYAARGRWQDAIPLLEATNNIPEVTGRVCPALCEHACVLGLTDDPVTVRENELDVIEYAFQKGLIKPRIPKLRTGKKVAVVGSGPSGLSCAAQINRAGHDVVVFERDKKPGGLLRYGIPDFKLEKNILDRRIDIWKKEGIIFKTGVEAGKDYSHEKLLKDFDALCLACGSRVPRDLKIKGRDLKGICFAMDYLIQANLNVSGEKTKNAKHINAKNKKVVVIGGGDTGADCVGAAHRQGASCVVQIEVMPRPPESRTCEYPWPRYPLLLKQSSSHEEGGERFWAVLTKKFIGKKGRVSKLSCINVSFVKEGREACPVMKEVKGSEFEIDADLVILAIGFLHPEHTGIVSDLGIELDKRGNVKTDENYMTSVKGVFSAGDMRMGQSLVVWAIQEGRRSAYSIDKYLMGSSDLPVI